MDNDTAPKDFEQALSRIELFRVAHRMRFAEAALTFAAGGTLGSGLYILWALRLHYPFGSVVNFALSPGPIFIAFVGVSGARLLALRRKYRRMGGKFQ